MADGTGRAHDLGPDRATGRADATELGALAGTTSDVLRRLDGLVTRYARGEREDVTGALTEAERHLRNAVRHLERATRLLR